ncbi:hypothetical protein GCM10007170_37030 [Arthrobacter liuii]|uniref:DUF3040 domain-containing protein n=1 Tax=Arthrobacter liuii TaxID=1476996 RepID=A0ABQ2AWM1_9MICC|nr:hypothetical protein GCM10007170_37030 [Arthrobacter liuii]
MYRWIDVAEYQTGWPSAAATLVPEFVAPAGNGRWGETMPLSEFEKRELEVISHGLEEEDPRLAVLLGRDAFAVSLRTRFRRGLMLVAAGACVLLLGLVARATFLGIAGFAAMIGAAYWAIKDLRWSLRNRKRHVTQVEGNIE